MLIVKTYLKSNFLRNIRLQRRVLGPILIAVELFFALMAIMLVGCGRGDSPVTVYFAVDVSDRTTSHLNLYAAAVFRSQRRLGANDSVMIYAFAHDCEIVYSGTPIRSRSKFNELISSYLRRRESRGVAPNTRTDVALEAVVSELESRSKSPVGVVVLTDGGIEDRSYSVKQRIRSSAAAILKANGSRLTFAGLFPEHRHFWRDVLPKGERVRVLGIPELEIPDLVTEARR